MKHPPTIFHSGGMIIHGCWKTCKTQSLINHNASSTSSHFGWMCLYGCMLSKDFYQSVFYSAILINRTELFFPSIEVIMLLFSSSYKLSFQTTSYRSDSWSCIRANVTVSSRENRSPGSKWYFTWALMIIDFLPFSARSVQCNTPLIIYCWRPHNLNPLQWCLDRICHNALTQSAQWTHMLLSTALV